MKEIKTSKWYKKAQMAEPLRQQPQADTKFANNPLNGLTPSQAKKYMNNKVIPHDQIKGFFSDEGWEGVSKIWTAFRNAGVEWAIEDAEYRENENGIPVSKRWIVSVEFIDRKGESNMIYGTVIASGAGSVKNPLEKYDIIAYFN